MFGLSVCGQELKGCFICTASGEIYFFVAMISRGAWSLEDQLRYLIWYEWKTSKREEKEREKERERERERERGMIGKRCWFRQRSQFSLLPPGNAVKDCANAFVVEGAFFSLC
jgi:hypothetical protein